MPRVSSLGDLKRHLERTETVKVEDSDGSPWTFEIRPVWPMAWDPKGEWYVQLIASDEKAFGRKVAEVVSAPSEDVFRNVLVKGVHEPKLSERRCDDAAWVEDLMRKDLMARELYAAIAQLSFRGIVKVKAPDAKPRSPS